MKALTLFTTTLLLIFSTAAHAEKDIRIMDRGMDLDTRYYSIACPDGSVGSVSVRFNITAEEQENTPSADVRRARVGNPTPKTPKILEVCSFPQEGKERCSAGWGLQEAAKASCK